MRPFWSGVGERVVLCCDSDVVAGGEGVEWSDGGVWGWWGFVDDC